jgi:hypothetical protein
LKAYGIPRDWDAECPDRTDAQRFARKTSASGSDMKNKREKANTRRIYKRIARNEGKKACIETE